MKRTLRLTLLWALLAIVLVGCAAPEPATSDSASPAAYTTRDVPVYREVLTRQTIPLRFYDETPSIAYVSIADFYTLMLPQGSMDVECQDDGSYLLTSHTGADPATVTGKGLGGTAVVDPTAGTLTSPDLPAFTNIMSLSQEGMDDAYYDGVPYARVARVEYDRDAEPVTFDFARYGIAIHADDDGVYLPFQTLSVIYSDLANHYASFNGETVYVNDDLAYPTMSERDPDFAKPILAERTRPQDLADFSYAHLRFVIDYLEGVPGRTEAVLGAHDIDATLESMGEQGQAIKAGLTSTDLAEYIAATVALSRVIDDGGHTGFAYTRVLGLESEGNEELLAAVNTIKDDASNPLGAYLQEHPRDTSSYTAGMMRQELREAAYGDQTYIKQGDTAVIVFDSFTINNEAWEAYLDGDGDRPSTGVLMDGFFAGGRDTVAVVTDGLARAAADPEVANVVLDLSNNSGGSLDTLAFVASLVTGRERHVLQNTLTGQLASEYYDVDRNLDGSFDEKDAEVDYGDLRFAVLTSKGSFSCGNLFPSEMADDGVMIIGERSGGGSCGVEMSVTADGTIWQHSSWRGRLLNAAGHEIDDGVPLDVDLLERAGSKTVEYEGQTLPDYSCLYDIALLSEVMNEYYGDAALPMAA